VDAGTSVCDFDPEAKAHHYSIEASVTHCQHGGCRLNLIDTPGYPDFIGQTIGALRAVEAAAICVNGHTGLQINSRRVFQEAEKAHLGRIVILTKLDDEQADFDRLVNQLRQTWGSAVVPMQIPRGQGHGFKGVVDLLTMPDDPPKDVRRPVDLLLVPCGKTQKQAAAPPSGDTTCASAPG
jgi:elongation factor G